MNKIATFSLFTLLFLMLILNFKTCKKKEVKTTETTTTNKEVKQRIDSVSHDTIIHRKEFVVYDTIRKVILEYVKKPLKESEVLKEVVKSKDTFNLSNAKVYSTIFSEGKVLKHDLKVITNDSIITKLIERETFTENTKNTLFLNVNPLLSFNSSLIGAEASIDYTIKNKFRIGAGVGYIEPIGVKGTAYFKVKIGIPLN
ncbi:MULTISPECIES: hypothetical protein [unclassified Tenacibaculum]|uniref:hypothetical protein n=1 Tax=unclassified Tenacibaculum TaxID=2635139 RepID=UPI001F275879|nr:MULTISPECIES: hypothetical protein [unclassified Tenacibaculum]MCF2875432.1 hypothetical protein [Tenacibaculum sp. Cn5-1]MCF2935508.1 hypothetical protein [Tenacibaculum sp. Cn5-34]MCG7512068.1 hypothetical protein [Tenacibaculum sp. Cn5-46]